MTATQLLTDLRACTDGRAWMGRKGVKAAWATCQRSHWMLWALDKLGYADQRILRLLACRFARETPLADGRKAWDLLTDARSRAAVEVAERYANGQATDAELAAARDAAWDAARDAAWDAALDVAWAAARDAAWDAALDVAWAAARDAARDAAWDVAREAARDAAWAAQADMIREAVPYETVAALVKAYDKVPR